MSLKNFGKAALIVAVAAACGKNRQQVTDNGLKYQMHQQSEGTRKGKVGDIMTLHLTLMNNKDSVLRDTHKEGAPFQMLLQVPPFKGSYEEGLTMMGKGDSATFYVSADSLFTKAMQPLPPGVQKGTDIGIAVKVVTCSRKKSIRKRRPSNLKSRKALTRKSLRIT
jgi:hypothetical protein